MKRAAAALMVLPLLPAPAEAHVVIAGIEGFPGGLLHPLLVPAHTLALIALGLLAATMRTGQRALILLAFVLGAALSFALIAMAYSAMQGEQLVLCLGAAIGLLLAADLLPPRVVAALLALCIAGGVMFDSVPQVLSVKETVAALTGTALSATALVAATALLAAALPQRVRGVAIRIGGSWIAASAIMVLALRAVS